MKKSKTLAAAMACVLCTPAAHAIDIDAGDFEVAPAGTNLMLVYYQHAVRKDAYAHGERVPGEPRLRSDIGILRAVHYMKLGPYIVAPQVLLPFGKLDAGADIAALGSQSGVGDLILAAPVWFNQPGAKGQFSIAPYLIAPTGQYGNSKPLSLGENRWKFVLQAGYVQSLTDKLSLDLVADVQWNGRNDDYGVASQVRKQSALYNLQSLLRYKFAPGADLRIGLQRISGGENRVDGSRQLDRQSTTRLQLGGSYFFSPTQQVTVTYGRDLSVENGFKEAHRVNLRFLQVF
ncbi:transporter [Comamonas sp. Tr-654]|uniref:transporter n=1 Tax=Comamonas sp. Tr-654 TaxID=2608341 RepID=UPI001965099B